MSNNRIHIVHVHEKFYPFMGGSTHRLLNLLKQIDHTKFSITVLCENSEKIEKESTYEGISIVRYDSYSEIPKLLFRINRLNKIDIIHSHNYRPSFFSFFLNKLFLRKTYIVEMHSYYETTNKLKQTIGDYIVKSADKVIVLSKRSKDYLSRVVRVPSEKINIIYNGIQTKSSNQLTEFNDHFLELKLTNPDLIKLAYIGSLDEFQGIDNVINVVNETKRENIFFIIIGGSPDEINKVKKNINNPNVYTSSYIDSKYVNFIYEKSDALLVLRPSMLSTETAVPLKPIEAIVNKCKVLSTRVGGMLELSEIIQSDDIIFFDNIDEVIRFIDKLERIDLKMSDSSNVGYFDVVNQSKLMSQLYEELIIDGK